MRDPVRIGNCSGFYGDRIAAAREMVEGFADARLVVIEDASLFCHEERPAEVAAALLPVLVGGRGQQAG